MAIYHFSAQIITRAHGRSVISAAAYRAAERIFDERTGLTHNYTKKTGVELTDIILPDGAPEQFKDRAVLWNAVEKAEKRKDAQLCREINISLPRELSFSDSKALVYDFVNYHFVSRGMIADIAIHCEQASDGDAQPHAHIMLTQRTVGPDGFGKKDRSWNNKAYLLSWRAEWAHTVNAYLARAGLDARIDHRTLEEQEIKLEPQHKIGATASKTQRANLQDHFRIAQENGAEIIAKPYLALEAITAQQSTFTAHDIAKLINRNSVSQEQFSKAYLAITNCPNLKYLGTDEQGKKRYSTEEMIATETRMQNFATKMNATHQHAILWFRKNKILKNFFLSAEQEHAFKHLTDKGDLKCLAGAACTGKSYLLDATRAAWEKQGYRVIGVTLSGIAAENLEKSAHINSLTLASFFYKLEHQPNRLSISSNDVIVLDEAGMIGSKQMAKLLNIAKNKQAKVVLVGDTEQLQAIDAGGAFRAIADKTGYVALDDIRRQQGWQKDASLQFSAGDIASGIAAYAKNNNIHKRDTKQQAMQQLITEWDFNKHRSPNASQIILAHTRNDVLELNHLARECLKDKGHLSHDISMQTSKGKRELAVGDEIYFLKNDHHLNVKNGTKGIIQSIDGNTLSIKTESKEVQFNIKDYNHIDYAYAATVHKAQGTTVDNSYVYASKGFDRHTAYVAMTRHKAQANLYYANDTFKNNRELSKTLSRNRRKDVTTDYLDLCDSQTSEQVPIKYTTRFSKIITKMSKDIKDTTIRTTSSKTISISTDIGHEL